MFEPMSSGGAGGALTLRPVDEKRGKALVRRISSIHVDDFMDKAMHEAKTGSKLHKIDHDINTEISKHARSPKLLLNYFASGRMVGLAIMLGYNMPLHFNVCLLKFMIGSVAHLRARPYQQIKPGHAFPDRLLTWF